MTLLDALASFVGDQEYNPFAFGELSPDGTKFVVYFNELMTEDGNVKRGVLLADLVSGDISTQVIYGPGSDGVTWLGNDEVWVLGDYNGDLVIDAATADVSEIDRLCAGPCEFQLDHAQTSSEDFVVATNGAVLTVDRSTQKSTELAQIPITRWAQVLPLTSAVTVAARTEVTAGDFTQGASEPAVVGTGASPAPVDDPVSGTTALLLGAGAVLVLTTGVAGFELRRRNARDR